MNGIKAVVTAAVIVFGVFGFGIRYVVRELVTASGESTTVEPVEFKPVHPQVRPLEFKPINLNLPGQAPRAKAADPAAKDADVAFGPSAKTGLVRQWTAKSEGKFKPDDLLNPARIKNIAFHRDGELLVTVSEATVNVCEVATGKLRHSIPATKQHAAVVSRDGRFVAVTADKSVTIYDAETGRPTGTHTFETKQFHAPRPVRHGAAFSPSGEFLLLGISQLTNDHVLVLDSHTAAANKLKLPGDKSDFRTYEQIEPIPGTPNLLFSGSVVKTQGSGTYVTAFNAQTQKQTALAALDFKPWPLDANRGMRTSNNGRYIAAFTADALAVVDRLTDKPVFRLSQSRVNMSQPTFTPDGTRCLFIRHAQFYVIKLGSPDTYPSDTVELYDVKAGTKLAMLDPAGAGFVKNLTSIEVSHDGKLFAVAAGTRVAIFDFEATYRLAPLPPKPLPTEAERYPVE